MGATATRDFLQRIYALELGEEAWLAGLASATEEQYGTGLGTVALVIDASAPTATRVRSVAAAGFHEPGVARLVEQTVCSLPSDDIRALASVAPAGRVGGAERSGSPALSAWLARFGAQDLMTLLAADPSGMAVIVSANLRVKRPLGARDRTRLSRLAAHTAAARQLRDADDDALDAMYGPDGSLLEASGDAKEDEAAQRLLDTAAALAAVRRAEGERALSLYTSHVEARWSVIAHGLRAGEEILVARRNAPPSWPFDVLTLREREVASHLALGHSLKEVAYQLGLAHSTVRVLAARAMKRLGVASTKELARRLRGT